MRERLAFTDRDMRLGGKTERRIAVPCAKLLLELAPHPAAGVRSQASVKHVGRGREVGVRR